VSITTGTVRRAPKTPLRCQASNGPDHKLYG
jgi:hypothetical protein